jgi:transcriptional regulator with XRE-family HTH domain
MTALHRTEIGLLERGEREPKLSMIVKLAGALEVSLPELGGGIDWNPEASGPGQFEFCNLRNAPTR